jgi:hypothetical protein
LDQDVYIHTGKIFDLLSLLQKKRKSNTMTKDTTTSTTSETVKMENAPFIDSWNGSELYYKSATTQQINDVKNNENSLEEYANLTWSAAKSYITSSLDRKLYNLYTATSSNINLLINMNKSNKPYISQVQIAVRLLTLLQYGGTLNEDDDDDGDNGDNDNNDEKKNSCVHALSHRFIYTTPMKVWYELVPQLLSRLDHENVLTSYTTRMEEVYVITNILKRLCSMYPNQMSWYTINLPASHVLYSMFDDHPHIKSVHQRFANDVKSISFTTLEKWKMLLNVPTNKNLDKMKTLLRKMFSNSSDVDGDGDGCSNKIKLNVCIDRRTFEKKWKISIRDNVAKVSIDWLKYQQNQQKILKEKELSVRNKNLRGMKVVGHVPGRSSRTTSPIPQPSTTANTTTTTIPGDVWLPLETLKQEMEASTTTSDKKKLNISDRVVNYQAWLKNIPNIILPTMCSINDDGGSSVNINDVTDIITSTSSWDVLDEKRVLLKDEIANSTITTATTLYSIDNSVEILDGSKKKPKKMTTVDTNGERKVWLIKGGDAPEVDQRIIQMERVINRFMHAQYGKGDRNILLPSGVRASTYCVIPIGQTTGMIEWIDDRVSMFHLYQRWWKASGHGSNRIVTSSIEGETKASSTSTRTANTTATNTQCCSPADDFYIQLEIEIRSLCDSSKEDATKSYDSKLQSILSDSQGRKELEQFLYPSIVQSSSGGGGGGNGNTTLKKIFSKYRSSFTKTFLIHVYKELLRLKSCPNILLTRELTMSSTTIEDRYHKLNVYKNSLAYNSIVGHIFGIGDRHLDNILINMKTGNLLHVDLSVSFGKGLYGLRVPEIVPFRMTKTMIGPLGINKFHGTFRTTCINTYQCIVNTKETLIEMLKRTDGSSSSSENKWKRKGQNIGNTDKIDSINDKLLDYRANEVARRIDGKINYNIDSGDTFLEGSGDSDDGGSSSGSDDKEKSDNRSVTEQVDYLLEVATNPNHLALMFEGWASWV